MPVSIEYSAEASIQNRQHDNYMFSIETAFEAIQNDLPMMYVNKYQKLLTYTGYYANEFARKSARNLLYLTHPMPEGNAYWPEVGERVKKGASAIFSIPLASILFIPAFASYSLAACVGEGRFEQIISSLPTEYGDEKTVKVMSLNACFQDPWAPLTGGIVSAFEPVGNYASRIAAVVHAIAEEDPLVFMGQEFESIGAQDEFIRLMQQIGFCYFLRDFGSNAPATNNSGLFIASKVPLQNVDFIPYPNEDKVGLAKWSGQGALTFTLSMQGKELRLVNVHLNYGDGKENQEARNRQLTRHVMPLMHQGNAVLLGDLNFDTASVEPAASGLVGFVNAVEGQVTCTDLGKHTLRGKNLNPNGKPCPECEERIDGLIYNPHQIHVLTSEVKPLLIENQLLSDHFAIIATLQIVE